MKYSCMGNEAILQRDSIALYCSARCPGNLVIKSYDLAQKWRANNQSLISGFHSPIEREVLAIMLRSPTPVCMVLARGLPKRIRPEWRRALDEGRLLIISPFDVGVKRPTRQTATRRNQMVAQLAHSLFVAYAAPGSKTESFCRALIATGKPCLTFDDPKTKHIMAMGFSPVGLG